MTYLKNVRDGLRAHCPTCATTRPIYVEETEGVRLTCCGFCQRILKREPVLVEAQ